MPPLSEDYMKSVSESELKDRAYTPFELDKHERDSIEDIKRGLKTKRYKTKDQIQDSLNYIETIANKINIAITNEKKESKTTWELEADLTELKKVFEQLEGLLMALEQKEVDEGGKRKRR